MTYPVTPNPGIHQQPPPVKTPLPSIPIQAISRALVHAIVSQVVNALTGGLINPEMVGTALDDLDAFGSDLFNTLFGSRSIGAQLTTTVIPNITRAMSADLQGTLNTLTHLFSGVSTGVTHSVTDVESAVQGFFTGLFNSPVPLPQIHAGAIPSIDTVIMDGTNTVRHFLDSVYNAIHGTSVSGTTSATAAATAIGSVRTIAQGTVDALNAAVGGGAGGDPSTLTIAMQAIPQGNVVPTANPSPSVDFDAEGTGWTTVTTTTAYGSSATVTGSHTVGADANYAIVPVTFTADASGGVFYSSQVTVSAMFGTKPMTFLGSDQVFPSGSSTLAVTYLYGVANPDLGANTVTAVVTPNITSQNVYGVCGASTSLIGVHSVGAVTHTALSTGGTLTQTVSSAVTDAVVQVFTAYEPTATSVTLGSYSGTSRANPGNLYNAAAGAFTTVFGDAAGAPTDTFTAVATVSGGGTAHYSAIAVNLISNSVAAIGSVFRAYRASTTAVNSPTADTPESLALGFFDNNPELTGDLAWNPTSNALTVSYAGTYAVTLSLEINGGLAATSFFYPILYKNADPTPVRVGSSVYHPAGAGSPAVACTTFQLYLKPGDFVQPGVLSSASHGACLSGESTGAWSYFEVALMNRSVY